MFRYLEIAKDEIGQKEITGTEDNPRILEYFTVCSYHGRHDEVPWCAAFVNWCLVQAGMRGTRSAAALSFENWGTKCEPCLGAIAVLRYPNNKGHVAFAVGTYRGKYVLLGGNQSNSVCYKVVDKSKVTTFRLPPEVLECPADPLPELASVSATEMTYRETR